MDEITKHMAQVFAEARAFENKARVIQANSGRLYVLCAGESVQFFVQESAHLFVRWLNTLPHFNDRYRAMRSMNKKDT